MRSVFAVLLVAIACLGAATIARSRLISAPIDGNERRGLERFEAAHPAPDIDLATLYAGRLELLDASRALPQWHRYDYDDVVALVAATAHCPPSPIVLPDASLAKALRWHAATCAGEIEGEDALLGSPPFMHPSGASYASLARAAHPRSPEWTKAHAGAFHVTELRSLDAALLGDRAPIAAISPSIWASIVGGDDVALDAHSLVTARQGVLGLASVRIYPIATWVTFATAARVALVPRNATTFCASPASSTLCFQPLGLGARPAAALAIVTNVSAIVALFATVMLALLTVRERRRAHDDRVHVLRVLTHELRTPATSLRLDVEPLRAHFDDLPEACQEPLLRLSDGVERLDRVLHRSARYLALFETREVAGSALLRPRPIASASQLFEELAEEWPEGVAIVGGSNDGPISLDDEWLAVAVRNLVENAVRHGAAPVTVGWSIERERLVVRVQDGGDSSQFRLQNAIKPFDRSVASGGLGLGLALVARIAAITGGALTHTSAPTTFTLTVPCGA